MKTTARSLVGHACRDTDLKKLFRAQTAIQNVAAAKSSLRSASFDTAQPSSLLGHVIRSTNNASTHSAETSWKTYIVLVAQARARHRSIDLQLLWKAAGTYC